MQIKKYLSQSKLALVLYKSYRRLYLKKQKQTIYIQAELDLESKCYVKGNILVFSEEKIDDLKVKFNEKRLEILFFPIHTFDYKFPGFFQYEVQLPVIGFQDFNSINQLTAEVVAGRSTEKKIIPLQLDNEYAKQLSVVKAGKLKRINDILICPLTREALSQKETYFESINALNKYSKNSQFYNFLPPALVESFNIISTHNISAHDNQEYEKQIIDELQRNGIKEPLILDCGSGLKPTYRKEVLNFEIVEYPTTDVLGVNEKLPFKDNSFDAVFSSAVLEHVKDPFASAKEICRVLKPGGILMAFVPFLQPYHGYPHHYYNMTVSGIRNLFDEDIDIKEVGTNHHPLDLFPWYIGRYVDSLSEKDKKAFMNLKMKDFRKPNWLATQGFYNNISQQTHEELAFVVKTRGYKKL